MIHDLRTRAKEMVGRRARALGFDIIRHPSSRLRSGQTALALDHMNVGCVLDVGANVGQYAQFVRSVGYDGPMISFEPQSAAAQRLHELAADDDHWQICRTALGSARGEATINITRATVMSSLRAPSDVGRVHAGDGIEVVDTEVVPVHRLDALVPTMVDDDAALYLKMSVQGWEREVLAGATECLSRVVGIQSIVSVEPLYDGMDDWLTTLAMLRDLGFTPTGLFPLLHRGPLHVTEFEVVMVRPLDD